MIREDNGERDQPADQRGGDDGGCGLAHGSPGQPFPPRPPLGLGLGLERHRPFALVGEGKPLCLLAPVIALAANVVALPAHVTEHRPEIA
jgi:hypothetical protein